MQPRTVEPRIERRVPGDGVELACVAWEGEGEPIVAIHGLTASSRTFVGVGERLARRRALVAIDLRGRGDSDKPAEPYSPYSIDQHARDVAAAMRALGIGRTVVVGHSMGAYVATALAADAPELVAGLVLLDGGMMQSLPPDASALLEAVLAPLVSRLTMTFTTREEYRQHWAERDLFIESDRNPWLEEYLDYDLAGEAPELRPKPYAPGIRQDFFEMARTAEVEARLQRVRVPVHVIRAEFGFSRGQPPLLPEAAVERILACAPQATVETIAGTTHYTILLAEPGATRVADSLVAFGDSVGDRK